MSDYSPQDSGGFFHEDHLGPPKVSNGSFSNTPTILPQTRSRPLRPGSLKESNFIAHLDDKLLGISRRYEKRFDRGVTDDPAGSTEGRGYETFEEVVRDMEIVVDLVWVSGTRMLLFGRIVL